MSDPLYDTRTMMRLLGIRSRQTLYTLGLEPSHKDPGPTGRMWWSRARIEQIAADTGRVCDWDQL